MRHTLLFVPVILVLSSACSVVAPPPLMMHQTESTFRNDPGGITAGAFGGAGGGVFLNGAGGGVGVVDVQATDTLKVGLSGGGGATIAPQTASAANLLGSGRVYGQYRPADLQWLAVSAGLGFGGMDSGMRYGTADIGISVGGMVAKTVRPYATLAGAVSVPFIAGRALDTAPWTYTDSSGQHSVYDSGRFAETTLYGDLGVGLAIAASDNLELAAEVHSMFGQTLQHDGTFAVAATAGLRYRFGKPAAEKSLFASPPSRMDFTP